MESKDKIRNEMDDKNHEEISVDSDSWHSSGVTLDITGKLRIRNLSESSSTSTAAMSSSIWSNKSSDWTVDNLVMSPEISTPNNSSDNDDDSELLHYGYLYECSDKCKKKRTEDLNKRKRKIFVGNLSPSMNSQRLWKFFENSFGKVEDAFILRAGADCYRVSKRCGFVRFSDFNIAKKLIQLHEIKMGKRILRINSPNWQRYIRHTVDCKNLNKLHITSLSNSEVLSIENYNSHPNIDILSDDCFRLIFNKLTIKELITSERVCRRWLSIIKSVYSSTKSVVFPPVASFETVITVKNVKSIMNRLNPLVIRFADFSFVGIRMPITSWKLIGQFMPNLTGVNFSGMVINEKSAREYYYASQKKLKELKLCSMRHLHENTAWWLFKSAPELELLELSDSSFLKGNSAFHQISTNLKTLIISKTCRIYPLSLSKLINRTVNLEKIILSCVALNSLPGSNPDMILDSIKDLTKLKSATFSMIFSIIDNIRGEYDRWISFNMVSLTSIDVSHSHGPNKNFVLKVGKICKKLKYFNISQCFSDPPIDDEAIIELKKGCRELIDLNLNYSRAITDDIFYTETFSSNLKTLKMIGTPESNLTDDGITAFLYQVLINNKNSGFKLLNLTGCLGISMNILHVLSDIDLLIESPVEICLRGTGAAKFTEDDIQDKFQYIKFNFDTFIHNRYRYDYSNFINNLRTDYFSSDSEDEPEEDLPYHD